MSATEPRTVIATYRVRAGREDEFLALVKKHYPTLRRLGLATDDEPVVYRGAEQGGGPIVFEVFTWKDPEGPDVAHQTPEVMAIWEAMGELVEERGGKPKFEFPHVERLELAFDDA